MAFMRYRGLPQGELTAEEFWAWLGQFDADHDGRISREELQRALQSLNLWFASWKAREGLRAADTDCDGGGGRPALRLRAEAARDQDHPAWILLIDLLDRRELIYRCTFDRVGVLRSVPECRSVEYEMNVCTFEILFGKPLWRFRSYYSLRQTRFTLFKFTCICFTDGGVSNYNTIDYGDSFQEKALRPSLYYSSPTIGYHMCLLCSITLYYHR
jgi:hypothetical protein